MVSFDHLKTREVAGKSLWLAVPQVTDSARLKLRPAADVNVGYRNGLLKMAASRLRRTAARGNMASFDVEQSREDDRVLYPEYVIEDWEGIEDAEGNLVPFSRENAAEFFAKLPDWIFDRIRVYAMVPENFLDRLPDVKGLVGNSSRGSSGS